MRKRTGRKTRRHTQHTPDWFDLVIEQARRRGAESLADSLGEPWMAAYFIAAVNVDEVGELVERVISRGEQELARRAGVTLAHVQDVLDGYEPSPSLAAVLTGYGDGLAAV